MTKAILISPEDQSIEAIELSDDSDISALIGFETIESDAVGDAGDRLYFDEECFIRGTSGRFQIDTLIPVAGKGVVVGTTEDGKKLTDVTIGIDELRSRTSFQ
jgi:hypothetical protein